MSGARRRIRWSVGALAAGLALATSAAAQVRVNFPATLEREPLLLWLQRETDISPGQVIAVTPQALTSVVSTFPAGPGGTPRVVIRAEALSPETYARTGALSWHVSLSVDCGRRRVKLGETTGYPERNLIGERKVLRAAETDWRAPEPGTALDHAWRSACEPGFTGPFKAPAVRLAEIDASPAAPRTRLPAGPAAAEPVEAARPAAPAPSPRPARATTARASTVVAQVGAVSSEAEARRLLSELQPLVAGRATRVERAVVGGRTWHRALVGGFAEAAEATRFCTQMRAAGRGCFTRAEPPS